MLFGKKRVEISSFTNLRMMMADERKPSAMTWPSIKAIAAALIVYNFEWIGVAVVIFLIVMSSEMARLNEEVLLKKILYAHDELAGMWHKINEGITEENEIKNAIETLVRRTDRITEDLAEFKIQRINKEVDKEEWTPMFPPSEKMPEIITY